MEALTAIRATDEAVIPFPPTEVWRVLADFATYPSWWPRALGMRVLHHEGGLVGSEVELRPFGGRPFRCRVEAADEARSIRTQYYGGFINGRGEWRLEPVASGTRVRYELDVQAAGRLAAWLSGVLPLGRLHSRLMQGILRRLEQVLRQSNGVHTRGKKESENS